MTHANWQVEEVFENLDGEIGSWLKNYTYPWEALADISKFILDLGPKLDTNVYTEVKPQVWVANSAKIHPLADLNGPAIIGERTELRPGAYIRGNVFTGADCVLGNSCEFKNSVLLNHVQVPHFSYVGDSILGDYAHLGAGVICSNFRQDKGHIKIRFENGDILDTGLRKMGVIAGDHVEVGCQAVLNPGSLLGKRSRIYPLAMTRIAVPHDTMLKTNGTILTLEK